MPSYLLGPSLFIAILEILAPGFSPGSWLLPYPIFQLLDQEKHPGHDASLKTKADHKAQDWSFLLQHGSHKYPPLSHYFFDTNTLLLRYM